MTIKVGDRLPNATVRLVTPDGPKPVETKDYFAGKKIVLFGLPGAFTPTCHKNHLPGFIVSEAAFKAKGVDAIAMTTVNDHFVLSGLVGRDGLQGPYRFSRRRRRRLRQGSWPRVRRFGRRLGRTLQALCDAGGGRGGERTQYRALARPGGRLERRASSGADEVGEAENLYRKISTINTQALSTIAMMQECRRRRSNRGRSWRPRTRARRR